MGTAGNKKFVCLLNILRISVLFQITDSVDLPIFIGPSSNTTVTIGRDATLTCHVGNLGKFKVAWLRMDTETVLTISTVVVTKNYRVRAGHYDEVWTLTIREVVLTDQGSYMCQVNTEPMITQVHRLHIVVPPDIDNQQSSKDVLVKEGENASLHCVAAGTPVPNILWRREDSRQININNQTLVSKWMGTWLNMSGVERTASGAYLCIATNGVPPSVSKRIQLNVMFSPKAWTNHVAVRALASSDVLLRCWSESYPLSQMYWTLNDEQRLVNSSKHVITKSSQGYYHSLSLIVTNMTITDAGEYRCHVQNTMGRAQAELFLHMLTTTTTTSTTTTITTSTTSPSTTLIIEYDTEHHVEQLNGAVLDSQADNYIILSRHHMQNLDMETTI